MKRFLALLFVVGLGYLAWTAAQPTPPAPGSRLATEPFQAFTFGLPISRRDVHIQPVAIFHVDARVFAKARYADDTEAVVSPFDLVLGWGPLVDDRVAEAITVTQQGRFGNWHGGEIPMTWDDVGRHMANMHIIPADPNIERFVAGLVPGQRISLGGYLVNVTGPDHWVWKSSLTRNDSGDGACEVFYVTKAELLPQTNRPAPPKPLVRPAALLQTARPSPTDGLDIRLTQPRTFIVPYGTLTVPAGGVIRLTPSKEGKAHAVYQGISFPLERAVWDELRAGEP